MLTRSNRPQFVEKVLTDSYGRQYRVLFAVTLVNGEVKGRIISATLLSAEAPQLPGKVSASAASSVSTAFYLSGSTAANAVGASYIPRFSPVVSPFSELFFFNSQPTRAPSLL